MTVITRSPTGALKAYREAGTSLRELAEPEQAVVLARLLKRLWREPPSDAPFRSLSSLIGHWRDETLRRESEWRDRTLVREGLDVLERLAKDPAPRVLLATDLHARNVLRAERDPWLAIDPKPFVGDPCYDATQHLPNCPERMQRDDGGTIRRFADLLEVDAERVRLWWFGRTASAV